MGPPMVKKTYKMRFKTRQIVENGLTANKTKINTQTDKQRTPFCVHLI